MRKHINNKPKRKPKKLLTTYSELWKRFRFRCSERLIRDALSVSENLEFKIVGGEYLYANSESRGTAAEV